MKKDNSRTLVEIAAFPPPIGAWSQRIEFVAEAWRTRGHECILLNIGASRALGDPRYLNVRGPLDYLWQLIRLARRGCVLHTHTNAKGVKGNLLALAAHLISLLRGRRSVLTFHAGLKQEYFPKTGKLLKDWLLLATLRTARLIICNSQPVKNRIVSDYGVAAERIFPIQAFCAAYMQTELGRPAPDIEEFAAQHEPLLVSYVFFFHPEFHVDMMVRAVARLRMSFPNLGLIIMGSKRYAENYQGLIDELGLGPHILLPGNLPRPEFLAVLKRGRLYLRTPMGDGVASSVLEALAMDCPVVAVDNGTRPQSCVLYRDNDLEDMLRKIEHVLDNHRQVVEAIVKPEDNDTVSDEVDVIMSASR